MSVKVQHALYDLIKSMTKSEKRYFKVLSSRHTIGEENNYVVLFDFIDQMDEYDEHLIHEHFEGEAFLNRFTITKKRLYDHILNALDAYHAEKSPSAQLFKLIHSAEILFNKSLYDQCRRVLNSAEKQAEKLENELVLAMILDQKKRLFETNGYEDQNEYEETEVVEKYTETLKKMSYVNELWRIKSQLFRLMLSKGIAKNKQEIGQYNAICEPISEVVKLQELNGDAVYLINHIRSVQKYAIGELEQSYHFLRNNLKHFESNDVFRVHEPQKYLSVLTNAVYVADRLGKHNEALQLLTQLKREVTSMELSPDLEMKVFTTQESIQLSLELRMGEIGEIVKRRNQVYDKLNAYQHKMNPARKAFIQYKLALSSFVHEDYLDCLKSLDEILQEAHGHNNEDLRNFAFILEILCFIELGKDELVAYKLKSFRRHVKKYPRFEKLEQYLIAFFSSWLKSSNGLDRIDTLEKLQNQFYQMESEDESCAALMEYFDFIAWTKSKIEKKAMHTCMKERYNANMRNAS